ncbi:GIY-YIG nuclease family protein [Aestuariibaculum sp. M13]|uniref:GIY-YIG nuclease family protein n=1 Tax=Aestuariibaculum sp. M13 TaxID=2967132 RepID=UPI0035C0BFFC
MKCFFVYILKCSDDTYYTGITNNLEKRFSEHQSGLKKNAYTYNRRPISLEFQQNFNHPEQAIAFEKKIKK